MLHKQLLIAVLVVAGCSESRNIAFTAGSEADEEAIRSIIDNAERLSYADDVDWENAFGGRFTDRQSVENFLTEMVDPTMSSAEGGQRVTVRFLSDDLAIADSYWWLVGQSGPISERNGRVTYVLSRSGSEWRINVVRVADLQHEPMPKRPVDADNPWPLVPLSPSELSSYEGHYEEAAGFEGMMPVTIRTWVEGGILRSETSNLGAIGLVPMGGHIFAAGRYVDGVLVEIYWPDERQVFDVENGRAVGYRVVSGTTELSSARRIDES